MSREIQKNSPFFYKTCLYLKDTALYRNIFDTINEIDSNFSEKICYNAFLASGSDWNKYFKNVFNLLELDIDFLKLQALLEKTGKYKYSSLNEVKKYAFGREKEGADYIWGLYFSQIFWKTHRKVFDFFDKNFVKKSEKNGNCLEIPSGSGIFLSHFLSDNKNWKGVAIDISQNAIMITKKILDLNGVTAGRTQVVKKDFLKFKSEKKFDKIICGEFLEHTEDPVKILLKIKSLLADNGEVFLTTVAWTAGIDHIYLYKNVEEIKKHVLESGFLPKKEIAINIFDKDKADSDQNKKAVIYAAILKKCL